jgi:hypothetical protein
MENENLILMFSENVSDQNPNIYKIWRNGYNAISLI